MLREKIQINQHFTRSRFGHGKVNDLGRDGAGLIKDSGLVSLWKRHDDTKY